MTSNENQPRPFGSMVTDEKVRELVAAYTSGAASEQQQAELSDLITTSPEVCDYFIAHSAIVSQLLTYSSKFDDDSQRPVLADPPLSKRRKTVGWIAAAALLLGIVISGVFAYRQVNQGDPSLGPEPVGEMQTRFAGGESPAISTVNLMAGERVSIETGTCQVSLAKGVKLSFTAPASFTMVDAMHCRLWEGRLTADVPEAAKGFRVGTSHADIVDHGTRFGVAASPETGTDIAVFEGRVDIASANQKRTLSVGRAASIAADGAMSRLQVVKPDTFESPADADGLLESTIISVSDNIRSAEEYGFYRIVPQGFGEDQPAYVDRDHQWNGVDADGLPDELIGGDYIMPFNSDKRVKEIRITLNLAREANLFILFDDRAATPDWLRRDFVDTGKKAGQDEGGIVPGFKTGKRTATGSGNSIDSVFSVWRRRAPVVGEVALKGLLGKEQRDGSGLPSERSMYGIVIVPLSKP